jgi:hypothetical protein
MAGLSIGIAGEGLTDFGITPQIGSAVSVDGCAACRTPSLPICL